MRAHAKLLTRLPGVLTKLAVAFLICQAWSSLANLARHSVWALNGIYVPALNVSPSNPAGSPASVLGYVWHIVSRSFEATSYGFALPAVALLLMTHRLEPRLFALSLIIAGTPVGAAASWIVKPSGTPFNWPTWDPELSPAVGVVFGFSAYGLAIFLRRRKAQLLRGCCPACGYDLKASPSGSCSECGRMREVLGSGNREA